MGKSRKDESKKFPQKKRLIHVYLEVGSFSKLDKHEVEMKKAQEEKESVSAVDCDGGASITHLGLSPDYVLSVRTSGHRRKLALETGHRVV